MIDREAVESAILAKLPSNSWVSFAAVDAAPVLSAICETEYGRVWVEIDLPPDMTWQEHYEAADAYAGMVQNTVEVKLREGRR